jgi:transcription elongation factor Elf1
MNLSVQDRFSCIFIGSVNLSSIRATGQTCHVSCIPCQLLLDLRGVHVYAGTPGVV